MNWTTSSLRIILTLSTVIAISIACLSDPSPITVVVNITSPAGDTVGEISKGFNPSKEVAIESQKMFEASSGQGRALKPVFGFDGFKLLPTGNGWVIDPTSIIGIDNRTQVNNPREWPYRTVGLITATFPNGKTYIGTGTVIGSRWVLTAGHVLYSKGDGGRASVLLFSPAQKDSNQPYGTIGVKSFKIATEYEQSQSQEHDFGIMEMSQDIGLTVGFLNFAYFNDPNRYKVFCYIDGYPGDKGGQQQWYHGDRILEVDQNRLHYQIDTMPGQSGSAIYGYFPEYPGQETIIGIHTNGTTFGQDRNHGVRINQDHFNRLVNWMR